MFQATATETERVHRKFTFLTADGAKGLSLRLSPLKVALSAAFTYWTDPGSVGHYSPLDSSSLLAWRFHTNLA